MHSQAAAEPLRARKTTAAICVTLAFSGPSASALADTTGNWYDGSSTANGTFTVDGADTVSAALTPVAPTSLWDGNSLIKEGPGRLTLTGENTYTGGTTIAAGTLRIGDGGTSGSVAGDIANHTVLVFDRGESVTYGGVISGAGRVAVEGTGILTLTGENTYTGTTFINYSTLRIGDGGTSGSVTGDIVTVNRGVIFERSDAVTYGGVISGPGTVTQRGGGMLTLTGENTYTSLTFIGDGTLRIGNGGTSGSVAGDIANNAALVFDRSDEVAYGGEIVGWGTVTKRGANTLTLTGDSNYGITTIESGTLRIGDGGVSGSVAGDIANHAALVFDRSDEVVHHGLISGAGTVTQQGGGTLTLTGNNTYTGDTEVRAGTLQFQEYFFPVGTSTLGGNIRVARDAVLSILTRYAVVRAAGGVDLADGARLSQRDFQNWSPDGNLMANAVTIGNDVTFNLSGVRSSFEDEKVLFGTTNGITGDFARVLIGGGVASAADYLTLNTSKSADGKRYVAQYELSWFNRNADQTHGTFTLGGGDEAFSVDTALVDRPANDALHWDGKSLTKQGGGTLTLTGWNTYSGGTTIAGGTLRIGDGHSTGSVTGDIVNHAALVFEPDLSLTYGGAISGAGTVTQQGYGILTLTGENTYSGGTTIAGGTLRIGDGGTSGSVTGDIANHDALIFNRSDAVTYGGVISGAGHVNQEGGGMLTLTGENTYTGATAIRGGGMLRIGNGGATGSIIGDIYNEDGALVFDRSDAVTYGGRIIGSGASRSTVTKQGSGTLTLTGGSIYTGITTIAAGTLRIGNGGTSGSVMGDIANHATLVFDRSNAATYGDAISGAGTVIQQGGGTLTLTGENTYTGGTTIAAGTLRIGDGGTSGSVVGDIANHAALVFERGDAATYGGAISGAGTVIQQGGGTLTLTGENTYTGGTTIAAGTLRIGDGGASGAVTGDIANHAALVFERSDAATYGGAISGAGTVTQQGGGTLTLTGENTYTGGTTIAAGTLRIGDGGTSGSVAGDIANNAALVFDRGDTATHDGAISGAGTVTKQGANILTLTGENTYTGITTIAAGTLRIGDGGTSGSVAGDIANNAALVFDRSDAAAYDGVISGVGEVTKQGADTLTLTGENTYRGDTKVGAGTLQFGNGATASVNALGGSIQVASESALSIQTQTAVHVAGRVELTDGARLSLHDTPEDGLAGASLTADTVVIGNDVTFNLSGVRHPFRDEKVLFSTTNGITGDFARVTLGDFASETDYLTLNTHKSEDNKRYLARYGLNWFNQTGQAHGTFTLDGEGETFTVDTALVDKPANDALHWDGKSLLKQGGGTLVLAADNTYSGGTTIAGGTLRIGNGGTSGSVAGDIANHAALVFDRSDAATYGGAISGAGTVTKQGGGTLTLTGENTYSGGATIAGGTLRIGDGGTSGSVTGDIANHAALVFDRSDAATYGGAISGAGTVTQQGGGTLTLTGENTYTGGTTIAAGTLRIGDGGTSGSVAGDIANNAALVFDRSDEVAYGGVISGVGEVTKQGADTLTLTGKNTYSGATTVATGTLKTGVANVMATTSRVSVKEGAALNLGGHSQTFAALDNRGTVLINDLGAPALANGVTVSGNMTNRGALTLDNCANCAGQTYTQRGNWSGENGTVSFGAVLGGDDSLTDKLVITGSATGLTYVQVRNEGGDGAQTLEGIELIQTGHSTDDAFIQKGRIAAGAYDYHLQKGSASGKNENNWYLTSVDSNASAGRQQRPELGSYASNLVAANTLFNTRPDERQSGELHDPVTGQPYRHRLWAHAVGGHSHARMSDGQIRNTAHRTVFQIGGDVLDGRFSSHDAWHVGIMAGAGTQLSKSRNSLSGYQSRGKAQGYSAGLYGTWRQHVQTPAGLRLDGWALYNQFHNSVQGDALAQETYHSRGITAAVESSYAFHAGSLGGSGGERHLYIRAQAQLLWSGVKANAQKDQTGAQVTGLGSDNLQTRLGARLWLSNERVLDDANPGNKGGVEPFVEVNWLRQSKPYGAQIDDSRALIQVSRNAAELSAGLAGSLSEGLRISASATQQLGSHGYRDTQGVVNVTYCF